MGVLAAARDDPALSARATAWVEGLARRAAQGRFLFTVTDVAIVLSRPERRPESPPESPPESRPE
jgi:hypothetical protein